MNVNNTLGERNPHCTIPVQWGIHAMGVDPAPSEPPPGLVSRARGGRLTPSSALPVAFMFT